MNKSREEDTLSVKSMMQQTAVRIIYTLLALFLFLWAIELMGAAFKALGSDAAQSIITATSNPFIGLFIGLLVTALIQSSSTSTSMVVTAMASGSINLPDAIPIIMGANIGTTLTSTIVSMGYITDKRAFRKAIAAGSVHDVFNILTVIILFPLEYYYRLISSTVVSIAKGINASSAINLPTRLLSFEQLTHLVSSVIDNGFILMVISFVMLIGAIKLLSSLISKFLIGDSRSLINNYVFNTPVKSFLWGTGLTAAVQSSSVTTCLAVPLVATGQVSLKKAFPFIMGANIGTTITAFVAVLVNSNAVVTIALAHLLINLIGVLIFMPFAFLRSLPVNLAFWFGILTTKSRITGFIYIIFMFFIIPFTLIYFSKEKKEDIDELSNKSSYIQDQRREYGDSMDKVARERALPLMEGKNSFETVGERPTKVRLTSP